MNNNIYGAKRVRIVSSSASAAGPGKGSRSDTTPVVLVIDDDRAMREAIEFLVESAGLRVALFGSPGEFLAARLPDVESCVVLDIRLPGTSGLEFHHQMVTAGIRIPVIFMTGYGDVPMSVRAMKAGAVDFLPKPFRDQEMLEAIFVAIGRDRDRRDADRQAADIRARYQSLSQREAEIMGLVTSGLLNKQIAVAAGVAEPTVKVHRAHVMQKMAASSLAHLVRMAETLGLHDGTAEPSGAAPNGKHPGRPLGRYP
jgi:FixJ family two-component response regulator